MIQERCDNLRAQFSTHGTWHVNMAIYVAREFGYMHMHKVGRLNAVCSGLDDDQTKIGIV